MPVMTTRDGIGQADASASGTFRYRLGLVAAVCAYVLTMLTFISFQPLTPSAGLDSSWSYALDYGSAQHMAFGRALIFTFGPLVSLYTDFRVPEHDALYIALSLVLHLGIFTGFMLSASPTRRPYIILLPLIVANVILKDSILFVLPLTLVFAACRRQWPGWTWHVAFGVVALANGLLPLVKGTTLVPVIGCTVLSMAAFVRDRSAWALLLPIVVTLSAVTAWLGLGQTLAAIPAYLINLAQVAGGYTEAMSIFGKLFLPIGFIVFALALAGFFFLIQDRHRTIRLLAVLGVGYVAFKAGFVRQDGHAIISAAWLALTGLLLLLHDPSRRAYAGTAIAFAEALLLAGAYVPVNAPSLVSRLTDKVTQSVTALSIRAKQPEQLFTAYQQGKAVIRSQAGLPKLNGTTDIYPVDIASLLASDLDWDSRPILQSYSAYTPTLAALNARHLEAADAPTNILFSIAPIDERYPNLEDGASWPSLLSHYGFQSYSGAYAVLRRTEVDHRASIGAPVLSRSFAFDTEVSLPSDPRTVWASFEFHPTLPGRLLSLVFKRPPLFMDVTFRSGQQARFRMIAGMADGFLLSPVIRSARDFVALSTGDQRLLASSEVSAFRIHQASPFPFWGKSFALTLAPLTFEPHHIDDHQLYGTSMEGPPLSAVAAGGECAIDTVGDASPGQAVLTVDAPSVTVVGWGLQSTSLKRESRDVQVALTDAEGRSFYSEARRTPRPDVNRHFGLPDGATVGFASVVDLRPLHEGSYTMHIVQDGASGREQCPSQTVTIRR